MGVDWATALRAGKANIAGLLILSASALLEASVFPLPTEAVFLALALARPRHAWRLGALVVAASGAGALIGYGIGSGFGHPFLDSVDVTAFADVGSAYREHAFIALATSGYTPIPYLLYTIAAGAYGVPAPIFMAGAMTGRIVKYLPMVLLVFWFGPRIRPFLDRYPVWVGVLLLVMLIAWFVIVS